MARYYNTAIGKYVDSETGSVSADQSNSGEWYYSVSEAKAADAKNNQPAQPAPSTQEPAQPKTRKSTSSDNSAAGSGAGNANNTPAPQQSYYIRNGQRVATNFVNGHNVNADGSAISWQPGDISVTPDGQYWMIGDDGKAYQVTNKDTKGMATVISALGASDGYTAKGNETQIGVQQGFESWLQQNYPDAWNQYLTIAFEWNSAKDRGDTATMQQKHKEMENFRKQYGHIGKTDGTLTTVVDPEAIPEDLRELFAPLIEIYNESLAEDIGTVGSTSLPTYNAPDIGESPNTQLALAKISQYPELVKAIIRNAPTSVLAYQLSAIFPEYTVGEGMEPMEGLNYEAQYMPKYWEDFTTNYDPEKFAADYDEIRDQLIAANQAGVDLGRMQLEAQLENALPQYDELRAQSDLAKNKAANNMALYNQAQGDLGGIGSKRYSLEQNAYDQRMNEIQLEQQNLINTTNQQIAQLEAEGKMKEAQLLAEWAQAKLEAMQEQYNLYWDMYQQGATAMENLEYGIASDEWNRQWEIRQAELEEQRNKWLAEVEAYNAAVDKAKTELDVDTLNRDYEYQTWRDKTAFDLEQAQQENEYNANAYAAELEQQIRQLEVDQLNRDYEWNKWVTDTELAISQADKEYDRDMEVFKIQEELRQRAFENAMTKLEHGMLSDADLVALGVPEDQAKAFVDRFNILAQLDVDMAKAQLQALQNQLTNYKKGGSGGGGGGGYTASGDGGTTVVSSYTNPETGDEFGTLDNGRTYGIHSANFSTDQIMNNHNDQEVQVANYGTVKYSELKKLVSQGIVEEKVIKNNNGRGVSYYYIRNTEMGSGKK